MPMSANEARPSKDIFKYLPPPLSNDRWCPTTTPLVRCILSTRPPVRSKLFCSEPRSETRFFHNVTLEGRSEAICSCLDGWSEAIFLTTDH